MGHVALAKGAMAQAIAHHPGFARGAAPHRIGRRSGFTTLRHLAALLTVHPGEALHALIPAQGRPAAAGDVALDQFSGQFGEKHRGHRRLTHAAPEAPLAGMGKEQPLLRPGDPHVAKAALLLEG